jgi:hypothetical protein
MAQREGTTPIEVHLSMPDGLRLPIPEISAAYERALRINGRRNLESAADKAASRFVNGWPATLLAGHLGRSRPQTLF